MRTRAWLIRSFETTAPIVVSDACSAIGPSAAWSARTISPPRPSVGSCVFPTGADGDGEGEAPADPLGAGEPLGAGLGLADGAGEAAADPDAAGEPDGVAEPLAPEAPGLAEAKVGAGVAEGAGGR